MGKEMAKNLVNAGYKINLYNRTREKCYELEKLGANICSTPKELALISNVIITMLGNEIAMDELLFGPVGVFQSISSNTYFINMSTVSVNYTNKLKYKCFEKGINFLDCPVSGSKSSAESKSLIILCGAREKDLDYCKNILLSMGKDIVYTGQPPNGTKLKLCINLLVASLTTAIVESVMLAKKSKIDPQLIFQTIDKSPVLNCGYFKLKEKNLMSMNFEPAFSLKNMLKDLNFIIDMARENNIDLKITKGIKDIFEESFKKGYYDNDLTVISKLYE